MVEAFEAIITWAGNESEKRTFRTQEEAYAWISNCLGPCPVNARGVVVPVTYGLPSDKEE